MADLVIRGMEMPQRCKACRFCGFGGRKSELNVCMFTGESQPRLSQERMSKCPLVPVPPHGRLIDAEAIMNNIGDVPYKGSVRRVLMSAPTIVPAEGGGEE